MKDCAWWEQVSAAIDGEVTEPERVAAMAHAGRCARCTHAMAAASAFPARGPQPAGVLDDTLLTSRERRWLNGRWTRRLLLLAAIVIVLEAVPTYIRGSGLGAEAHAARHLATWQIGFGIGLLVAAWVARLTYAMLALAATFALLTITATVIDVIRGHSGPWRESVHLVELVGAYLLWRITPPHLMPWRTTPTSIRHPTRRRPADTDRSMRLASEQPPDTGRTPP